MICGGSWCVWLQDFLSRTGATARGARTQTRHKGFPKQVEHEGECFDYVVLPAEFGTQEPFLLCY